jgi:6-pyruvoyltetrahydropterin/6-carboxytetrahydropterin synthase
LRDYQGKCENLHGHRYRIIASVVSSELDNVGLAFDFTVLKRIVDEILDRFDHTCLNDLEPFDTINPSSENIAATVYGELLPKLADYTASIESIEVWESPDSWVTYTPD